MVFNSKKNKKKISFTILSKFILNRANVIHVTSESEKESLKKFVLIKI